MSTTTTTIENNHNEDLIDLHVGSPILSRLLPPPPPTTNQTVIEEIFDNLIDTELPIFEKKLQTATHLPPSSSSSNRKNSVDIEDILITIDDDDNDNSDGDSDLKITFRKRCHSASILDIPQARLEQTRALSCDNLEALNVLRNLDDVLNASLLESNKILNINHDDDVQNLDQQTQQSVEACLLDLDNYLQTYDICDYDSISQSVASNSIINTNSSGHLNSTTSSIQDVSEEQQDLSEETEENLRNKLRQMEENYNKFLAGTGCINRGYIDTENGNDSLIDNSIRRPLSACAIRKETLIKRTHPYRATISTVTNKNRPTIIDKAILQILKCNNTNSFNKSRTSGTAAGDDSDDDIDWSWVQDVARDVTLERRAYASGDCCTGTVVVEPPHRALTEPSSSSINDNDIKEDRRGGTTTWLRTSMRRLRHFRLPSDDAADNETVITNNNINDMDITSRTTEPFIISLNISTPNIVRPVSAPSRLLPNNNTVPSERSRSRSRASAQAAVSHEPGGRGRSSSASSRSRRLQSLSSSVSSLASTVDSTPSCTPTPTHNEQEPQTNTRRPCERPRQNDMPETESPLGQWPHSLSSMMACLGCTLGLFNISRFAILTIHFGANFIFQFFFLSVVFGLPLFTLQLCLGQQLGAGVIDMWRISPLFQGVGVSLLISQALLGLYSIIGVSWMFVFFRDSFITKVDKYRWAEPFVYYREDIQPPMNNTYKLSETIPDYFSGIVLQRHHLASGTAYGTIKFQLAFNLAVVWMIVFVSLSKGLRSYGKVIYVFTLLPVFGTFILCAKILGMMPPEYVNIIFPETTWNEFFLNPKSWLAAAQEVFLTWGLLGTAVMQIASHNKHKHLLQRDSSLVAVITFTILLLVAFLANTCVQILRSYGYSYLPNSFERMSSYSFLRYAKDPLPPNLASTPVRYMVHNSFVLGEKVVRPGTDFTSESGYQVLRLATELIPATFAVMGSDQISPFWAVLFYFILILFGIAQQLAIWHCVITGIMAIKAKLLKSWETTITLFSCACGFILGLPMATELGIYVVYFMDYTVGGIWWLILIILLQIVAVFMVRGRPYSGDTVVIALFTPNNHPCLLSWAPALLSFTWNVILPVALMVLCITTFKNGSFRDIFIWHHAPVAEYWPLWARQIGSMIQLVPILLIPLIAVVQSYRYLNNGPSDILDRIQLLYRPPIGEHMTDLAVHDAATAAMNTTNPASVTTVPTEDPPPKYTPPPSYTTATGARIAKFLRQSIRRSVRRLANVLGESSHSRQQSTLPNQDQPPPPDYNAVMVEMNQTTIDTTIVPDVVVTHSTPQNRNIRISTLERLRTIQPSPGSPTLTAAEVASILRSSFRRSTVRSGGNNVRNFNDNTTASLSAENLVDSAAPIGETSLVLNHLNNRDVEIKCETNNL